MTGNYITGFEEVDTPDTLLVKQEPDLTPVKRNKSPKRTPPKQRRKKPTKRKARLVLLHFYHAVIYVKAMCTYVKTEVFDTKFVIILCL